jgi:DNA recombination protein RmuC
MFGDATMKPDMDVFSLTVLSSVVLLGFVAIGILIYVRTQSTSGVHQQEALVQWLTSMQKTIDTTNRTLSESLTGNNREMTRTLQENARQLNDRLDTAARVIGDLKKNVGEMSEVGKGIRDLQEFLQSPKLRGNIGEEVLSDMIGQAFPKNSFHLQYAFQSGMKVDAVLKTDAGLLCIDSKFPMENFTKMHRDETSGGRETAKKQFVQDVKKHVSDIAKKYILPEEGTMDFALMYIPSESVYYEVVNTQSLTEYARSMRVYPVSPNTLYAHLQVLLVSFQGKELEKKTAEIFRIIRAMKKDYEKIEGDFSILGKHITNAQNTYTSTASDMRLIGQKLEKATGKTIRDDETSLIEEDVT